MGVGMKNRDVFELRYPKNFLSSLKLMDIKLGL